MSLEKFKLLCWKNFTLQKRHPIAALIEIVFPILIVLVFSFARTKVNPQTHEVVEYKSFFPSSYKDCRTSSYEPFVKLGVSPESNQKLVELVNSTVVRNSKFQLVTFGNASDLENFVTRENFTIGIEFSDKYANLTELPTKLEYSLRFPHNTQFNTWFTDQLFLPKISKVARNEKSDYPYDPPYYSYCFLTIQNDIERGFIEAVSGKVPPATNLQRFPYPKVVEDIFIATAGSLFPLLFVFCLMLSSKNIIKNVTVERESQLKETMKMMGLSSGLHWLAWFTKCIILIEISIIGMTILMCSSLVFENPIFTYSNPLIVWLFFNVYAVAVITFCFLISVIFKKSSTAANVGTIFFFLTLVPYNKFGDKFFSFPYVLKVLFCLLVNSGMGQGVQMMLISEGNEEGTKFSNLFTREPDIGFSMGELLLTMILCAIIQMLLTLYIESVFPGDIGIAEPWYFPVLPLVTYLRKQMGYNSLTNHDAMLQNRRISSSDCEDEPMNLKVGIRITNLCKSFGKKPAVNKLNLNIFEDQITVLLGHNGAGKTTTMSMLTGMFPPSAGTAYLNGKDIRTEIDEARQSARLGLCPQHNILFDELTVAEHIIFFSKLKGVKGNRETAEEVRRYVSLLDLKDKVNAQSHTLSGGMKRKLSIGIALCGDSKIVMCDEPSSGMDPAGRRQLWDLLIAEKKGRTILLTTHHMDEADVLGDRIAIMAEGQLRTVGSSFFLKKKFGTGYKLTCVKKSNCNSQALLEIIQEFAPDAQIESDALTETTFIISEVHLPLFQHLFKTLEDNAEDLRISTFGCNLSTLEEVFLKLGTDCYQTPSDITDGIHDNTGSTTVLFNDLVSSSQVTGMKLVLYQVEATILKKFHYLRRNYRSILYMTLFSTWMIVVMMSAPSINFMSAPPLPISFNSYDETKTIVQHYNESMSLAKSYENLLGGSNGIERITRDMQSYFLEKSVESLATVNRKYLIGVAIKNRSNEAWFNGEPLHTMPLTLNTINRAVLKDFAGNDRDIFLTNKPFVKIQTSDDGFPVQKDVSEIIMPFVLLFFLLIYWPSVFIGFHIKERESRAKLLQFISGANRFVYWFTSFIFDYTIFLVVICALLGGIGFFQRSHFSTAPELGTYLLIFSFYGFATLPLTYAMSYVFSKHSTGESMVAVFGIFLALVYAVYAILRFLTESAVYKVLAKCLYWFGLMFGPFSLLDTFRAIGVSLLEPGSNIFTMGDTGIGRNLVMMIVGGFFFITICLMKDHLLFEWFIYKFLTIKRKLPERSQEVDSDVQEETERIQNMSQSETRNGNLVLKGLTKFYGSHLAVNQLHLAVESGECFGLLGINGAGKTTTFKMMTGDELISSGDASIRGYSMRNEMHKVHTLIGYCPQFDALLLDLTGRETLRIFSLIRGIPKKEITEITNKLSSELGFHKHLDKKVKAFSGGNKRKLSTALALIGNPSLIFLDEPTTGMDPGAKRQLWQIINKTRNSGRSVVMTSHSMEECEALCTKLAIMVNGEFKCLGSTQHLKNKYSRGFILTIKAGREDDETLEAVKLRVLQQFPSAEIKEQYMDISTFHLTASDLKWSEVFATMSLLSSEMELSDYSLTQTSLENVFLFFTKRGLHKEVTA